MSREILKDQILLRSILGAGVAGNVLPGLGPSLSAGIGPALWTGNRYWQFDYTVGSGEQGALILDPMDFWRRGRFRDSESWFKLTLRLKVERRVPDESGVAFGRWTGEAR